MQKTGSPLSEDIVPERQAQAATPGKASEVPGKSCRNGQTRLRAGSSAESLHQERREQLGRAEPWRTGGGAHVLCCFLLKLH